jgi:carbonic anhydrase
MKPEHPRTAIVACMDARLDAAGFLDSWPEPIHVVRNAGGRVTDDALRSLAVSCTMGAKRIAVVHHTDCAMAKHTDEQLRALLPAGAGAEVDFLTIADHREALRQDVATIVASALIQPGIEVSAFIYDLDARKAREIQI